jgi:hypothetical protein
MAHQPHPLLISADGSEHPIVSLAKVFDTPDEDELADVCIPLKIQFQRRVARCLGLTLPSEDAIDLARRVKFWTGLSTFFNEVLRFAAVRTLKVNKLDTLVALTAAAGAAHSAGEYMRPNKKQTTERSHAVLAIDSLDGHEQHNRFWSTKFRCSGSGSGSG